MQPLPEAIIEDLQVAWIPTFDRYRTNNILTEVVRDLGTSLTALHVTLEEESQMTIVAKDVDAKTLEDLLLRQNECFSAILRLVVSCEALTVRVDHFLLQAYQGACTYSDEETSTKGELTMTFRVRKERLYEGQHFEYAFINPVMQQLAFLNAGVKVTFEQAYGERQRHVYHYPNGIVDYFNAEMDLKDPMHNWAKRHYIMGEIDGFHYQICFCIGNAAGIKTFANNVLMFGCFEDGIKYGILKAVDELAKQEQLALKLHQDMLLKKLFCMASVRGPYFDYDHEYYPSYFLDGGDCYGHASKLIEDYLLQLDEEAQRNLVQKFQY